jgi:peptide/nickel transport system ATP-binding protein
VNDREFAVTADAVSVGYHKGSDPVVRDVSFEVPRGSTLGIVGESGSGKSTLARAIVGLQPVTSGRLLLHGEELGGIGRARLRTRIQMVFQDPYGSLPPHRTGLQTVAEVFRVVRGLPRVEAEQRARSLLDEVGLTTAMIERKPAGLSGGQRQRVGIARALACDPEILVADEPTSALDISVQAQILNLLLELREARELTVLLVSHDLGVIRHLAQQTIVLQGGVVVEHGETGRLLAEPVSDYTRMLVGSLPDNLVRSVPPVWPESD